MNRTRVAVVGLSVCLLVYLAFYWWVHASPLPSISKIASIEARIFLNQKTKAYEYDSGGNPALTAAGKIEQSR
jgi:hypothetical protein